MITEPCHALFGADDFAMIAIATLFAANGLALTANNLPTITKLCEDFYLNSSNKIKDFATFVKNSFTLGVLTNSLIIADVQDLIIEAKNYLNEQLISNGQIIDTNRYLDKKYGDYQFISQNLFDDFKNGVITEQYMRDFLIKYSADLGYENTVFNFHYKLNVENNKLRGGWYNSNNVFVDYGYIGSANLLDLSFQPIIYMYPYSGQSTSWDNKGFYFCVFYKYSNGVFANDYVFTPIQMQYGVIPFVSNYSDVVTDYPDEPVNVPYVPSPVSLPNVSVPRTYGDLVGKVGDDVMVDDAGVSLPNSTPLPTTIPNTQPLTSSTVNDLVGDITLDFVSPFKLFQYNVNNRFMPIYNNFKNTINSMRYDGYVFEDIHANLWGQDYVVVKLSLINDYLPTVRIWSSSIFWLFYAFYVYEQFYFLIRGNKPLGLSISSGGLAPTNSNSGHIGGAR